MHNLLTRLNNASAFLSSCMMALVFAISLSSFLFTADPKGDLSISSIKVVQSNARRYPTQKQDLAFIQFNISADLTPLFHWNTKQLFLYLEAEYVNGLGVKNEVVIWDRIVRRKEDAFIKYAGKNKYMFRDISSNFKDAPSANYSLRYNVMPYIGLLKYGEAAKTIEPVGFPTKQARL